MESRSKFTTIHDRLALEMNRCLQKAHVYEWMTKVSTTLIQKDPPKRNRPKQLQTYDPPTYHVENINGTNKGRDLFLANKQVLFPEEQKGCCKGSRGIRELFYIDQHVLNESKMRRKNLAMAWIDNKKGILYVLSKLDSKLSQNV